MEGMGFSARPKTALALTIDKLVERAFQKPAWLTGRAACRLLSGLVLARADARGWPVDEDEPGQTPELANRRLSK